MNLTLLVTLVVTLMAASSANAQAPARSGGRCRMTSATAAAATGSAGSTPAAAAGTPAVYAPTEATSGSVIKPVTSVLNTAKTPTATSSDAAASPTGATTSYGGKGKRGLAVPWDSLGTDIDAVASGNQITWMYNWESYLPPGGTSKFEFVAMLRTGSADDKTRMDQSLANSKAKKLMCLNEPDIADQANLSIDEVVNIWKTICWPQKKALGLELGAPAMSNGPNGIPMLKQFMAAVGTEYAPDFVPLHWYGTDINDFTNHVKAVHDVVNKPVWVTEFASQQTSAAEQKTFMTAAMTFLDGASYVARYSWFAYSRTSAINDASRLLSASGAKTDLFTTYSS